MNTPIHAPRGNQLNCTNWDTEAALRLLMNNLDPEVAERPDDLVVCGGTARAARNWESYHQIVAVLKRLTSTQTLLVQSGKPVGVFETHARAPRVLIANANLVANWATWLHFNMLERLGLTMYGQMTAGSWIYIGAQGIIQGNYQVFAEIARQHYGASLKGKWILTAGLGGMGGAQPLAAKMLGASMLVVESNAQTITRRINDGFLDVLSDNLDNALAEIRMACARGQSLTIGLQANAADIYAELIKRGVRPDIVTDQTPAHDPLSYMPSGWTLDDTRAAQTGDRNALALAAKRSMAMQVEAMLSFHRAGVPTMSYGNNIRQMAADMGVRDAFSLPDFVATYIRPLFCMGLGPFRWVALSGDADDIYQLDALAKELFPQDRRIGEWIDLAQQYIPFQGLPARICWMGLGVRHVFALAANELVRKGVLKAPIAFGRDHFDGGAIASPNIETEGLKDNSDAVADWPILNALLNTASGASWVSFHHGGGAGIGFSDHAGSVVVADGTDEAAEKLKTVLFNDPATAVMRYADAGYDLAIQTAHKHALDLPMVGTE